MKTLEINIPDGYEIDKKNSTFEKIVFKPLEKNNYPKTWEKCIEKLNNITKRYYWLNNYGEVLNGSGPLLNPNSNHYNLLPSEKDAVRFLILQKLWTCRKAYVEDWQPDWTDTNTSKYIIKARENKLMVDCYYTNSHPFSFPTSKMAEEFLKNFKSNLEFVKNLL